MTSATVPTSTLIDRLRTIVGPDGMLKSHRFTRAVIRVAANIAYEDAQRAIDGEGGVEAELLDTALRPLWDCWKALFAARQRREPPRG